MDNKERLTFARNVINNYNYIDNSFSRIYPFTTENLCGYMGMHDFNGKSVLTVGSSTDQIINAHMMGAKRIVCFDTNPLTEDYFNLKRAAFKSLSFEEFVKFFCYYINSPFKRNKFIFNSSSFDKIINDLPKDSYYFWMSLFNEYKGANLRKRLFSDDEETLSVLSKANSYMNKEGYKKIVNEIDLLHPTFITSDIRNIHKVLTESFDYIMLSNIACFIQRMYKYPLEDFRNNILKIKNFLTRDGVMFMAYLYDMKENTITKFHWDLIYHLDKVFEVFKNENISKEYFTGIKGLIHNEDNFTDLVLTLKK